MTLKRKFISSFTAASVIIPVALTVACAPIYNSQEASKKSHQGTTNEEDIRQIAKNNENINVIKQNLAQKFTTLITSQSSSINNSLGIHISFAADLTNEMKQAALEGLQQVNDINELKRLESFIEDTKSLSHKITSSALTGNIDLNKIQNEANALEKKHNTPEDKKILELYLNIISKMNSRVSQWARSKSNSIPNTYSNINNYGSYGSNIYGLDYR
ncbi:hypothetical protein [Mycoplasma sp. 4423]